MTKIGLLLLASTSMLGSSPAFAQNVPPPANPVDNGGVQDIVVTAQRRAENLMSVPLSISATTGTQLNNSGIKEISSLQFTTPGFLPENGVGYTQVFLRGIGNNVYVGSGPSVTTYIDDVPRIFSSMVNAFYDVSRVEVLKGAQGGLYGLNSTGGVINIITRQPTDKAAADAKVSYGTRHTLDAAAYVNVPLSDHIAWNFAITRESHAPYIKNETRDFSPYTAAMFPTTTTLKGVTRTAQQTADLFNSGVNPPKGYGNQNFWAIDSKLRIQASDNLKITFAGDYSKKHDSDGDQWTSLETGASLQSFATTTFYPFVAGIRPPNTTGTATLSPSCAPGVICLPADFFKTLKTSKWSTWGPVPAFANLVDYGGSAKIDWDLPNVTLTSISAYRAQHTLYENASGTDNIPLVIPIVQNHKWYLYQEFRAVSTGAGPFHLIAGGTYQHAHLHYNTVIQDFGLAIYDGPVTDSVHRTTDWSVYGQVGYDLTDKLNLTVSGRYVHLKNTALFDSPVVSGAKLVNSKFLPSANLSYKINGGVIYARYAKGYKEGGINPVVPPSLFVDSHGHVSPGFTFVPEQTDTYEVGIKGTALDHKLQYTAAAFYNKFRNLQTTTGGDQQHSSLIEAIINAGSARTWGFEGSVTYRPIRPLTLGVNAGYLNAKFINFKQTDSSAGLVIFDFSGQRMIYAPKLQAGFTADLDQPLNDKLRLVGNALVSHISRTKQSLPSGGSPSVYQRGYWLTNLRVGLRTTDDHVGVYLFVNNLFDQYYTTFGSAGALGNAQVEGEPRIIGGEVQIKF